MAWTVKRYNDMLKWRGLLYTGTYGTKKVWRTKNNLDCCWSLQMALQLLEVFLAGIFLWWDLVKRPLFGVEKRSWVQPWGPLLSSWVSIFSSSLPLKKNIKSLLAIQTNMPLWSESIWSKRELSVVFCIPRQTKIAHLGFRLSEIRLYEVMSNLHV